MHVESDLGGQSASFKANGFAGSVCPSLGPGLAPKLPLTDFGSLDRGPERCAGEVGLCELGWCRGQGPDLYVFFMRKLNNIHSTPHFLTIFHDFTVKLKVSTVLV